MRVRTFTEQGRRAQIVAAAIETIAELGYGQASFARIAERAGLSSTRLISYHFDGKAELIEQVVTEVYTAAGASMAPAVAAASTATEQLRAYLRSSVEFMRTHPLHLVAISEILRNHRDPDGALHFFGETGGEDAVLAPVRDMLTAGQQAGEFRAFSVPHMAWTLRAAIDDVGFRFAADPGLDLDRCAAELTDLFAAATRRTS
jgi:TetR/AcrR family fatty acid metabolism transcriptional regulator